MNSKLPAKSCLDCAAIARPLTQLTSLNVTFEWNDEAMQAFEKLKKTLADDVTLSIVDFRKEFILATDASDFAIGAVLLQSSGRGLRPVHFFSRVLNVHEVNYPTHEKELLAIVAAIEEFDTYLKGRQFTVQTDSQCLVFQQSSPQ